MTNKVQAAPYHSDEFVATKENENTIASMLEVYKSVIGNNKVFYCSAPVTSGKRYLGWLEHIGKNFVDLDNVDTSYRNDHFEEVVKPNRRCALRIIQKLREKPNCVVVDPTALPHLQGWTQRDWHSFWGRVIERYVKEVYFVNDWEYSNGCVYEFWVASRKNIPVFSEDQQPLNLQKGIDLIVEAVSIMQQQKQPTIIVENILDKLVVLQSESSIL